MHDHNIVRDHKLCTIWITMHYGITKNTIHTYLEHVTIALNAVQSEDNDYCCAYFKAFLCT